MKLRLTTDDAGALMTVLRRERTFRRLSLAYMAEHTSAYISTVQRREDMADGEDGEADTIDVGFLRDYAQALGGTLTITVELP